VIVSDAGKDASHAWQWREGRLLAYELLLQFLIKNHLLYTFGTAQPSTSAEDQRQTKMPQTWYISLYHDDLIIFMITVSHG